jgi:hypothetical protein
VQAFLAGVYVGLQLAPATRRRSEVRWALLTVLAIGALVVLAGSMTLLAGFGHAHPQTIYFT